MPHTKNLAPEMLDVIEKDRLQTTSVVAQEILQKIKHPLAQIRGRTENLANQLQYDQKDNAQRILDQIEQLEKLLEAVAEFTTGGEEQKNQVHVHDLVNELLDFFSWRFSQAKIQVSNLVPTDLLISTAEADLKTVLRSTLMNAIEALESSHQDNKNIFIQYQNVQGQHLLSIEDNGPGIQSSMLRNLFRPFSTTKQGHVGLSLAICRKIAEKRSWKFKVTSRNQIGTQVQLWIP